ncbi:MAG: histidine--tRNA ligase [Acidobacteria bacterium]|nr:MAG: histidine--tRNA ligase [Acidobacteriota bacterium]MCE7959855.1 histidine--tRNA ligase [Acidobacteria bacterium ACB2]
MTITSVKGTRDLLPPESRVFQRVEDVAHQVFALHGYEEVRTPVLEPTELFVRSVGESTDIVHKEMYTFVDRGGRSVTLRPENTAGVARAYVEHRLAQAGGVRKLYYVGPQFRYERPQKGRYREFRQIGAEVLGAADAATDAELLVMLFEFLGRLGFTGLAVSLNSVGSEECRPAYVEALRAYLAGFADRMGEDDRRRLEQNPLRVLDTKDPAVKEVLPGAPRMLDHLDPASRAHHEELLALLDAAAIPYRIEPRLVRGLDYYTRTVFEVTAEGLGAQDALLGGGRYDRLVSDLGGPRTPGIGFAIGEDRLVDVLPAAFREAALAAFRPVAVVPLAPSDRREALLLARELRASGVAVDLDPAGKGPGAGLKGAERKGLKWAVLLGEKEREEGTAVLKDLESRAQETVPRAELISRLKGNPS